MPYITIPVKPKEYQYTFDDILNGVDEAVFDRLKENTYDTKTVWRVRTPTRLLERINISEMISILDEFNSRHESLFEKERSTLYETFYLKKRGKGYPTLIKEIYKCFNKSMGKTYNGNEVFEKVLEILKPLLNNHPCDKHDEIQSEIFTTCINYLSPLGFEVSQEQLKQFIKSGYRRIDAPIDTFKSTLRELKFILEKNLYASYHTAAFAYVKGRCTIDAVKRHQKNKSKWFLKIDFTNFFGSTTIDFVMAQLKTMFPFNEIMANMRGEQALRKALSLCFLNGGLPQGTPISPTITNVMMIPIDHAISKAMREHTPHICYTRYADDMQLSSDLSFKWDEVQAQIIEILSKFNAPFSLNTEKTRYGSSAGRNWNLGVMLNKDNQITIGHEKKKSFKAMLFSFLKDYKNGIRWSVEETQVLNGLSSYYIMVEGEAIKEIIKHYNAKCGIDFDTAVKEILS